MSIIRFGIAQSILTLRISAIFVFSLIIISGTEAALEISVTTRDGNPAAGVNIQVFKGDIEPNSDAEPISPSKVRADGLVGFETNSDGKVNVNVSSGEYTVVAFSSQDEYKFVLMKKAAAPGQVHLSEADAVPITVTAWNAKGEPIVAANIFFRPCKRCQGLVGQVDNSGMLKVYVTPGMYHVILNSAFGLQYLVRPNQRIAKAGGEINFDIAKLPTTEVIFDLPERAFPAIYEVLETELTYEYVEKIEETVGYDAAYTNVYSLIGSGPVTLTAGLTYHFNMSYVVQFDGAFYAYELRPQPLLLSEGSHHIGNTGVESFRAEIFLDKSEYHPEDTVRISYKLIDTRNNQMSRYFDYSGARLIFPFVTVRNPDGVVIASNPNTFDFFDFDFKLPNSARLGEYQIEVNLDAQMYSWISDTATFNVTSRPDVSPPQISQITAPTKAEAGSEIILKANIKDNIRLSNISLNLSHDGFAIQNEMISPWSQSDNQYTFKISEKFTLPGLLSWKISATDSAGNEAIQQGESISITDTSPPIIEHEPIETAEIGVTLKIEATIMDNVDITDAILSYQLNDGTLQTLPMNGLPSNEVKGWKGELSRFAFHISAEVPASNIKQFGALNYSIQATDSTGNIAYIPTAQGQTFIVAQIVDTIPPKIYHAPVKEADESAPILIDALVSDNHEVSATDVKLNYKSPEGENFNAVQMKFSDNFYSALIPAEAVTESGIEYFIAAADEPDNQGQSRKVRTPVAGENYFITVKPSSDKLLSRLEISPSGTAAAPLELEAGTIHSFRKPSEAPGVGEFTLKAYDETGKPMQVKPLWSVTGGIGMISQQGVFTTTRYIDGGRKGTIIATLPTLAENSNLWQAITQVIVKPSTPQRIALMPRFVRLSAGEQQYFYVAVMDAYDNEIPVNANELDWNISSDIGSIHSDQSESAQNGNQWLFTAAKMGRGLVELKCSLRSPTSSSYGQGTKELTAVSEVQVEFGELKRIAISPASAQIVAGKTQKFTASGFDSQDNVITIAPIWSVRNGIGTIKPDGLFKAGLAGDGAIVATLGELVAEVLVTVKEGELSRITSDPFIDYLPLSTAKVNNYRQFVAFGWDAAENPVSIQNLKWQTDKAAGTIDNTGLLTATTERGTPVGNIVINGSVFAKGKSVTGKNLSAKSVVVIQARPPRRPPKRLALFMENFGAELPKITMAVGAKQKFEVTGFDAGNQRMRAGGGVPQFSVLGDIGFVSPDGIFTATKRGVGEILALDSGLTARATIEVTDGTLKSIAIKPEFLTLEAGESYQFNAFGFDQFDNAVPVDEIQWLVDAQESNIPPALVNATGKVTARYPGACQLIVRVGDIEGYAQLFIQPGKLHNLQLFILDNVGQISLSANSPFQLTSNTQIQFVTKGYDIAGNELTVMPNWGVSNTLGRIAFDGNFTAIKSGETVVTARQGLISTSVKIQVTPGELHQIEVYPNPLNLIANANPTQQFRAEGYDVSGNLICQPITQLSWEVVGNLGIIDDTGLFQAREGAKGSGYVVATPDQHANFTHKDGTAYISVTDFESAKSNARLRLSEKIKELIIVPNKSVPGEILTLRVGEKQKFYALGITDISQKVSPILAVWNVTNSIGYIDANGSLTATAVGNGKVTATLGGISVDCPILVIPSEENRQLVVEQVADLTSEFRAGGISEIITIPDAIQAKAGEFIRINAIGNDSSGNLISINPSWRLESSTASLGSVSSNGLFIGNKSGTGRIIVSASGISTEIPVEVSPNRPTFALIQPESVVFAARDRTPIQFVFFTFDKRGNPTTIEVSLSQVQWKAIGDIGTIDSKGTFTPSSLGEEQHGEVIAFVPELNLLGRSSITLHGYDSSLKEIRIEPDKIELIHGTTYRFRATVLDSIGRIVDIPANWRVFNSNNSEMVDVITPDGVFAIPKEKADIGEQFRVVASVESRKGILQNEALVTMVTGPLDTIEVEAPIIELKVGETAMFSALGRDAYENPKKIRPTWRVIGNIGTASHPINEGVKFTATSEGIGTIIATQGGIVGKAEISVIPAEPSVGELEIAPLFDFVAPDVGQTHDNPLQIQPGNSVSFIARNQITKEIFFPNWSITSKSSMGIISIDGEFTARQVGEGKIQATIENPKLTAEFFIRIIPGELASIRVTPAIVSVLTKDTQQFSAEGYDAYGNLVIPNSVRWDVTGGVGTIDSSGMFTPTKIPLKSSIQGTVIASVSGICSLRSPTPSAYGFPMLDTTSGIGVYGSASVTVVSELGPLSVISMTAEPVTVGAGGVSIITVFGADADGNPIAATDFDAPIIFTLTPMEHPDRDGDIGQITSTTVGGLYRAPEKLPSEPERQITISAATTVDGKMLTAEVSLILMSAQLAQVELQPKSVTLKAGDTQQFHLTASDAFGNPTPINSTWELSEPLGTLSNQQPDTVTYTAAPAGEVELSVTVFGANDATTNPIRATATIIVQPNEPASLRIEPDTAVIVSGERREFQVIGVDVYNNEIDDLKIEWHIDGDIVVGNLEPITDKPASQIFSAAAVGKISIVAKFQSISAQSHIQVIHGELSSLKILLVAELVSGWEDVKHAAGLLNVKIEERNNQQSVLLHQLISGGKYIFRAIGQDEHQNEFSPPVRWTQTGDIGQIETNTDDSSLVLYQATFVEKGRLLATSGTVSAEVAIEILPISQKIGKQGGHVNSPADAFLIIPPGALKDETEISIAIIHPLTTDTSNSQSKVSFVDYFDFQPGGLIFKKPAQLSISYADAMNKSNSTSGEETTTIDETKLSLYFWDSFQEKWIRAGGKVDTVKKTVTASVNHLAPYTIMESKTEPPAQRKLDISDIKLTPQVFYAPETNRLTIEYNLAVGSAEQAEVTVNIYDILGRLIATPLDSVPRYAGKHAEQWDGIDKDDRTVRNGRYIVVIIAKAGSDTVARKKLLVVFK